MMIDNDVDNADNNDDKDDNDDGWSCASDRKDWVLGAADFLHRLASHALDDDDYCDERWRLWWLDMMLLLRWCNTLLHHKEPQDFHSQTAREEEEGLRILRIGWWALLSTWYDDQHHDPFTKLSQVPHPS